MARLPRPGGDDRMWGGVLNQFLLVSHNPDGTTRAKSIELESLNTSGPSTGLGKNLLLTSDGKKLSWIQAAQINVSNYGAVGDGVNDDTAAVQAAIDDARWGGVVVFPKGVFLVSSLRIYSKGTSLVGSGRWATRLERLPGSTAPLIDMSGKGPGTGHNRYNLIQDITISGKGAGGALLRCYYADNCIFRGVSFMSCPSMTIDFVEVWDSRFEDCSWEYCGSANEPAVLLRNSLPAGKFGHSTDNTNQIHFTSCRWEGFKNGALKLDGTYGGSTRLLNGIFLVSCKMESSNVAGPALQIMPGTTIVFANQLYIALLKPDQGFNKPVDAIVDHGSQVNLSNIYIEWGHQTRGMANSAVHAFSGDPHTYRNLSSCYPGEPPSSATIVAEDAASVRITPPWTNHGPSFKGEVSQFMVEDPKLGVAMSLKNSGAFRIVSATSGKDLVKADNSSVRPTLHTVNGMDLAGFSGDFEGEKWRFHGDSGFVNLASGKFQIEGEKGYLGINSAPNTGIAMLVQPQDKTDRGLVVVRPRDADAGSRLLEFQDENHNVLGQAFDVYGRPFAVGPPPHVAKGNQVSYANPRDRVQDIAGNISAAVKPGATAPGTIATITFSRPFASAPLGITINDHSTVSADLYVSDRNEKGFTVSTRRGLNGGMIVNFDYIILA